MYIFKAKEYQSEKSPIFDSQKSTKTTRKLHRMSQLYAAKVCQLFCNTRYSSCNKAHCCLPLLLKEYLRQLLATTGTSFWSPLMDEFSLGLVVVWDSVY